MIFLRYLQKRDSVVLEVLLDAGGMSELDLTMSDAGATRVYTEVEFLNTQYFTGVTTDDGTTTPDLAFDIVPSSGPPTGIWLRLAEFSHDIPGTFDPLMTVTKLEDALGTSVLGTETVVPFTHISPSAAQLAEADLLDALLPSMGLSSSDSLGKRHTQPYDPSSPIGSQGIADAPVVNAFLNYDEIAGLIRVGLLTRGSGPIVDQIVMPEAGKRMAGFAL
jgi:hypothetical protein